MSNNNPQKRNPFNMHVHIRAVERSDLNAFFRFQSEPEGARMAAVASRDEEAFYAHWDRILSSATATAIAIVVDDDVAGYLGCWEQDGQHWIGYWLGQHFWNRGIASIAVQQFLDTFPSRPIHAIVAAHNVGSMRVLEKCGFIPYRSPLESDGVLELEYYLPSS